MMTYFRYHRRQFLMNTPEFKKVKAELDEEFKEINKNIRRERYLKNRDYLLKKYRQKVSDPETRKLMAIQRKEYCEKNKAKINGYTSKWQKNNKEKVREYQKRYRLKNPDKAKKWARTAYLNKQRRKKNVLLDM